VEFTVFPGAVHGFDEPSDAPVRERPDVPSRLHPGRGVLQGAQPDAREAAWERVAVLLREALKP
jgi:dienelactone hydrolase